MKPSQLAIAVVSLLFVFTAVSRVPGPAAQPSPTRTLSMEERVQAQRAIEEVYWKHRIWPKENPAQKPPLAAVMTDETIRARVEDYLRKSNALERIWQSPITAEQLQAEMSRMAARTRDPETLRDLFAALGNDSWLIAETLARQTLANRLIRDSYASDDRFHGEVRRQAEAAIAGTKSAGGMRAMGGDYVETTFRRGVHGGRIADRGPEDRAIELDSEEWNEQMGHLARRFGTAPDAIPLWRLSGLQEDPDRFFVSAVLSRREGEAVVASVVWPKRTFESWWSEQSRTWDVSLEATAGPFTLPVPADASCADDTWETRYVPQARRFHSAVWTGTEMIVWGGMEPTLPNDLYYNTGGRYNPSTDTWAPTSTGANVPAARDSHTAVWTGTEMIVWGGARGAGSSNILNTGGRYNPTTDSWMATSTGANVPTPRSGHTAVWTGTEMIVWGGFNSSGLNTGGRYNPSTETWTPTAVGFGTNVPTPRSDHTAVWTGTEMIVWGGSNLSDLNTGGRYNPSTNTWTPTSTGANVPQAGRSFTTVWTGTEMIVWGGSRYENNEYHAWNTGSRYNPSTDSWLPTSTGANVPAARYMHAAVWTGTEMIIWGGLSDLGTTRLNTGGRYNPATNTWTVTSTGANVPMARTRHTAVWTGTQMIVWGGSSLVAELSSGGRYTPSTDSWTGTGTNVPTERYDHTAVWTGTEMIVWGGYDSMNYLTTGGRYVPSTDSWTATSTGPNTPTGRQTLSAVWTGTEMIVWGGWASGSRFATGGRYAPATDSWTATSTGANLPEARNYHTAVWTGTEMIVWGGIGGTSGYTNTGGRYSPPTNTWLPTSTGANVPSKRRGHTAVWTGTEMIVWGGYDGINYLATGGRYVPSTDTWAATSMVADVPAGRVGHTAVWTGTRMIVWGGYDGVIDLNTGSRYVPTTDDWTVTSTGGNAPSAREGHTAVWTGAEMIVWGGFDATDYTTTGGRYNPWSDTWVPTSTGANLPLGRFSHTAVWTGTEMIVWGGYPLSFAVSLYCAEVCPTPTTSFRDQDGDGYGNPAMTARTCDGAAPTGYVSNSDDCDDAHATVYPGAPQICDGLNNDCSAPGWPAVSANEADGDADGWRICAGDCDDGLAATHPGAPEINDGRDNQCPGDPGYGSVDEMPDNAWQQTPGSTSTFCWTAQQGATDYEVVRSTSPGFSGGCTFWVVTGQTCITDPVTPPTAGVFFYLVRPLAPYLGSWGKDSRGVERTGGCFGESSCTDGVDNDGDLLTDCADRDCFQNPACTHTFTFTDTAADDVPMDALYQFFGFPPVPSAYILFQIDQPNLGRVNAWCSERADFYHGGYLVFAQSGNFLYTGNWAKWWLSYNTGLQWVGPDYGVYPNGFGPACAGRTYAWCSQSGLGGLPSRVVDPWLGIVSPRCEIFDVSAGGCGDGTWRLTIRVAPTRQQACSF